MASPTDTNVYMEKLGVANCINADVLVAHFAFTYQLEKGDVTVGQDGTGAYSYHLQCSCQHQW